MREIGSEFWDVPTIATSNSIFPGSTQWFLSGRSALTAIIREIKREVHTVAMPSWCCDSMIVPFLREGLEVQFYPVYVEDGLKQEIDTSCDALFLMDYFGYTTSTPDLSGYKGVVIRDVTHSLFSHSYSDADYYFGSLRKWCGVKTGGYAWGKKLDTGIDDEKFICLRTTAMLEKSRYINGEIENKDYLKVYEEAEDYLDALDGIYRPLGEDIDAARRLDITHIWTQRRKNARVLMRALAPYLIFPSLSTEDCPMFVPILVPDGKRDVLRRYLIQHDIYCPIHWPVTENHKIGEREMKIYKNELSLVCDQRYTEEDMLRMVEVIKKFMED